MTLLLVNLNTDKTQEIVETRNKFGDSDSIY